MPAVSIRIKDSKEMLEIVRKLEKNFGSKYRVGTYAVYSLYILSELGFRWYHIPLLKAIVDERKTLSFYKEPMREKMREIVEFLDGLLKELFTNGSEDDIRAVFTAKELEMVRKIAHKET